MVPDPVKTNSVTTDETAKTARSRATRQHRGLGAPVRTDGRKAMLTYMDEELIVQVKTAALVHDMNAYEIIEEAARLWLEKKGMVPPRKPADPAGSAENGTEHDGAKSA